MDAAAEELLVQISERLKNARGVLIQAEDFKGLGMPQATAVRLTQEAEGLEVLVVPEDPERHWLEITLRGQHSDLTEYALSPRDVAHLLVALVAKRYSFKIRRYRVGYILEIKIPEFRFKVSMKPRAIL